MDTKELLISKATELFAKNGYEGTTVKDIADSAGINVSLVSYHFGGKLALFHDCLRKFGEEKIGIAYKILQAPKSQQEFMVRFELFMDEITNSYVEQPMLLALVHHEFETGSAEAVELFKTTFYKAFNMVVSFFESAQRSGFIRKDVDVTLLSFLMMGCIKNTFINANLRKPFLKFSVETEEGRKKFKEHIMKIFLEGIYKEKR